MNLGRGSHGPAVSTCRRCGAKATGGPSAKPTGRWCSGRDSAPRGTAESGRASVAARGSVSTRRFESGATIFVQGHGVTSSFSRSATVPSLHRSPGEHPGHGVRSPNVSVQGPVKTEATATTPATGKRSSVSRETRALRSAAVASFWAIACAPIAFGKARCAMAQVLGIPCPGCGMTRAILLLGHGDVMASLRMHPVAVPNALASVLIMVATVWVTATDGTPVALLHRRIGRIALATLVAVQLAVIGVWVARMLGALGGPVAV